MASCPNHSNPLTSLLRAILLSAAVVSVASAQTTWTQQSSGVSPALSGIVFGGGKFVAAGEDGIILTSTNGVDWQAQTSGTIQSLRGVTYGNGIFVVVGQGGTALTSPDGILWTAQNSRTSNFLSGAAFGDGLFVAVGGSGTIRYSTDGISWELGIPITSNFLQSVSFGGGKFVAVGAGGSIIHSTDGQLWTSAASGTGSYLTGIACSDGIYIATGQAGTVMTSPDATTWSSQSAGTASWLFAAGTDGDNSIAIGANGTILNSPDGIAWTAATSGVAVDLNAIAYGMNLFVIVGAPVGNPLNGLILTAPDDTPLFDFEAWRQLVFTPAQLADPLVSGAEADPNCDEISNFFAFAIGLLPFEIAPPESLPSSSVVTGTDTLPHYALTFTRPSDRVGLVTYGVFCSDDLLLWTRVTAAEEIISDVAGVQTVRVTDPDPVATRKFYQLQVSGG